MMNKLMVTTAEWLEMDNLVTESLMNYAHIIADESLQTKPKQAYLDQAKKHYELLKGIQKALINSEEIA